jgi:Spy/CpxP family protein refolding chaperone
MHEINYPTKLTEKQWQVIKNILDGKERKRKHSFYYRYEWMAFICSRSCCQRTGQSNRL